MTRPTMEGIDHVVAAIRYLGWQHDPRTARNSTAFPDIAALTDLLVWYNESIRDARGAAAYGPGVKDGYRNIHSMQGHGDIDARTLDAYLKELRNGRGGFHTEFGQLVDRHRQIAYDIGRYPDRSEQVG